MKDVAEYKTVKELEEELCRKIGYQNAVVHWAKPAFVLEDERGQIHLVAEGQAKYSQEFADMDLVEDIRYKFRYAEK